MSETKATYGDDPLPDPPANYDLSQLTRESLTATALLDELRIALPLAEKCKKDEYDKGGRTTGLRAYSPAMTAASGRSAS